MADVSAEPIPKPKRIWTPFLLLVVTPSLVFFIYAYLSVNQASDSVVDQRQIERILVDPEPIKESEDLQPNANAVARITESVRSTADAIQPGAETKDIPVVELAAMVAETAKSLSGSLEDAGYSSLAGGGLEQIIRRCPNSNNCEDEVKALRSQIEELSKSLDAMRGQSAITILNEYEYLVFFGLNNAHLTPNVEAALRSAVATKNSENRRFVRLRAYADKLGSESVNCKIAARRAQTLNRFLVQHYPEAKIEVLVHGEYNLPFNPQADSPDPRNRATKLSFYTEEQTRDTSPCEKSLGTD